MNDYAEEARRSPSVSDTNYEEIYLSDTDIE